MEGLTFQLNEVLKYSTPEGDFGETATIEFSPPTYSVIEESLALRQLFARALASITRNNVEKVAAAHGGEPEEGENEELDAQTIMALVMTSDVRAMDFIDVFQKLALKTGSLAKGVKVKKLHFSKISIDDNLRMACEYIAFFVIPSLSLEEGEKDKP